MINYQSDVIVNRPVEQVYKLATDLSRLDDWAVLTDTHLISGGNLRVGSQMETKMKVGPMKQTRVIQMTELDEYRRFGLKTVSKGALEWYGVFTFESQGPSSTRMVYTGQIRLNGILKLFQPLMAGELRSEVAKELIRFKELVESSS